MAIQSIAPRSTSVRPFVIHAVSIPEEITQLEIEALLSLRNRARQLDQQIADAEESIRVWLDAGASVETGEHTAELKESFRRNVAWREVAERLGDRLYGADRGAAYCSNVLANTKPTRTVSLALL